MTRYNLRDRLSSALHSIALALSPPEPEPARQRPRSIAELLQMEPDAIALELAAGFWDADLAEVIAAEAAGDYREEVTDAADDRILAVEVARLQRLEEAAIEAGLVEAPEAPAPKSRELFWHALPGISEHRLLGNGRKVWALLAFDKAEDVWHVEGHGPWWGDKFDAPDLPAAVASVIERGDQDGYEVPPLVESTEEPKAAKWLKADGGGWVLVSGVEVLVKLQPAGKTWRLRGVGDWREFNGAGGWFGCIDLAKRWGTQKGVDVPALAELVEPEEPAPTAAVWSLEAGLMLLSVDGRMVGQAYIVDGGGCAWTTPEWGYGLAYIGKLRDAVEEVQRRAALHGVKVHWPTEWPDGLTDAEVAEPDRPYPAVEGSEYWGSRTKEHEDEALEGWDDDGHGGHMSGNLFVWLLDEDDWPHNGEVKPWAATNTTDADDADWRIANPVYGRHALKEDAMREAWGQWTQTIELDSDGQLRRFAELLKGVPYTCASLDSPSGAMDGGMRHRDLLARFGDREDMEESKRGPYTSFKITADGITWRAGRGDPGSNYTRSPPLVKPEMLQLLLGQAMGVPFNGVSLDPILGVRIVVDLEPFLARFGDRDDIRKEENDEGTSMHYTVVVDGVMWRAIDILTWPEDEEEETIEPAPVVEWSKSKHRDGGGALTLALGGIFSASVWLQDGIAQGFTPHGWGFDSIYLPDGLEAAVREVLRRASTQGIAVPWPVEFLDDPDVKPVVEWRRLTGGGLFDLHLADVIVATIEKSGGRWLVDSHDEWAHHEQQRFGNLANAWREVAEWGQEEGIVVPPLPVEEPIIPEGWAPCDVMTWARTVDNGDRLYWHANGPWYCEDSDAWQSSEHTEPAEAVAELDAHKATEAPEDIPFYDISDPLAGWEPDGDGFSRGELIVYPTPMHGRTADGGWPWMATVEDHEGPPLYGLHANPDAAKRAAHGRVTDADLDWTQTLGGEE